MSSARRPIHACAALGGASLALAGILAFAVPAQPAFAATSTELIDLQERILATSEEYAEISGRIAELDGQIAENQRYVDDAAAHIDAARERAERSMRLLYKLSQDGFGIVDLMVSSRTIAQVVDGAESLERIQRNGIESMEEYQDLKRGLDEAQEALVADRDELAEKSARIEQVQRDAQDARARIQEKAAAKARADAASKGIDLAFDGIDWSLPREEFVRVWAERLNAYLAGSPLAGTGEAFASAAWDCGVDPRLSAAISNTESSKGQHIPSQAGHNAWGLTDGKDGFQEFADWDEAIAKHTRYLSGMYGYTISLDFAHIYCPPNAESWFERTAAEMVKI